MRREGKKKKRDTRGAAGKKKLKLLVTEKCEPALHGRWVKSVSTLMVPLKRNE